MFLDGRDLRRLALVERKERLKTILPRHKSLKYSGHRFEHGRKYFAEAMRRKEEGVIAGYTKPRRSRKYFGSLVLSVRKGARWQYVGHAGTGFDAASLKGIYTRLRPLRTAKKPFHEKVKHEIQTTWVEPRLVGV
jgi:bifunctional non-homologous end joining protein LigD